jgi:hypothetical protein
MTKRIEVIMVQEEDDDGLSEMITMKIDLPLFATVEAGTRLSRVWTISL